MSIVKCPKCREQVSVPSSASPQAQVRCPMCGEEYSLQDALLGLPPALIVVHDPTAPQGQQITHGEDAGFAAFIAEEDELVAPAGVDGGDEFRFAPGAVPAADSAPAFSTTAPAFQFESKPVPAARPSSTSSRPRSRKKQGSPVRLIVQTIGGGVMGLIIAQFILWWMPGKWDVSNRDPFGLAAKVAPYAPFLLPANLRPGTPTAQADAVPEASPFSDFGGEAASQKQKPSQKSSTPPSSTAANKDLDTEIPEFTYDAGAKGSSEEPVLGSDPAAAKTKKGKGKGKQPSSADNATAKEATSEPGAPPDPFALPDQPAAATPTPDPFALPDLSLDPAKMKSDPESSEKSEKSETPASATATPEPTPEPAPAVELKNAPQLDADDVAERVAEAVAANQAWDTAENPTREAMRDMIVKIHDEMAKLGEAVAVQNLQEKVSDETRESVSAALESVATRTDKLSPLGIWAGMELPNRANKGAVFYGVVVDHKKSGALHEMQIKLKARVEAVVPVVSTRDLSQDLPAGTNILVVGRMVDAPADNLTGYEGEASTALLHGMHAVVPAE